MVKSKVPSGFHQLWAHKFELSDRAIY